MRAMSNKRRRQQRAWSGIREQVIERDQTCQLAARMEGHQCYGAGHVHHILRRSQGGSDHPSNLVLLCAAAHDWTHNNPAEAALFGLLALREGRQSS